MDGLRESFLPEMNRYCKNGLQVKRVIELERFQVRPFLGLWEVIGESLFEPFLRGWDVIGNGVTIRYFSKSLIKSYPQTPTKNTDAEGFYQSAQNITVPTTPVNSPNPMMMILHQSGSFGSKPMWGCPIISSPIPMRIHTTRSNRFFSCV